MCASWLLNPPRLTALLLIDIIVQLPSSINRIYSLIHPDSTNFGLNFAAALVLPCQGFWNGLIYIVTTLPACKEFMGNIWKKIVLPFEAMQRKLAASRRRSKASSLDSLNPAWDFRSGLFVPSLLFLLIFFFLFTDGLLLIECLGMRWRYASGTCEIIWRLLFPIEDPHTRTTSFSFYLLLFLLLYFPVATF